MKYKILLIALLFSVFALGQNYETHSYGEHSQQVYDVYFPENYDENTPLVIFVHGGGWNALHRQRNYYRSFVQRFFNQGNNIVVNMDYRLVEEGGDVYVFPDQIEDIQSVINHINLPNPVILTGNSAGGHLALWYYLNQVTPIAKIIPIASPYDGSVEVRPGVTYFEAAMGGGWVADYFINLDIYDVQSFEEGLEFASPHTYANPELSDIYYIHMTGDPLHQLEAIQRDYPNVEFEIYDTWHSGWLNNPHRDDLIQKMVDYIQEEEEHSTMGISYGEHHQQVYDIYYPDSYDENTPVVIFIHGGGWSVQTVQRSKYRTFVEQLFEAGENIVVNMDYRLLTANGNTYVFPDMINDITSVINHINLPNNPKVLTGNSAGGHLALWYYLNQVTPIQKVIPITAPYKSDVLINGVPYYQLGLNQMIQDGMISPELQEGMTSIEDGVAYASPHTYASEYLDNILAVFGTRDREVPMHQYYAMLEDYPNIQYELYDTWHSGWNEEPRRSDLIGKMLIFISNQVEECLPPTTVNIVRTSHTKATIDTDRNFNYQGSANRTGRPLRPYPMYGMDLMVMPFEHTALVPAFEYDVWLRAICEDGTYSEWSEPFYVPLFEEPTENIRYFNIHGQEVQNPTQGGYYIITDGKTSHKILKK